MKVLGIEALRLSSTLLIMVLMGQEMPGLWGVSGSALWHGDVRFALIQLPG